MSFKDARGYVDKPQLGPGGHLHLSEGQLLIHGLPDLWMNDG
jgi:hypothetical protein